LAFGLSRADWERSCGERLHNRRAAEEVAGRCGPGSRHESAARLADGHNDASIIEEVIARARVLGQQFLVWQMLWPEEMNTREAIDAMSGALNIAGRWRPD
jgi:hypothetical protein